MHYYTDVASGIRVQNFSTELMHDDFFMYSKIPENPPQYQKYYRQMNKVKQNQRAFSVADNKPAFEA